MAYEMLSVKLYELDAKLGRLHSRIMMSETGGHKQLAADIEKVRRESEAEELALKNRLSYSRSHTVKEIAQVYQEIDALVQKSRKELLPCAEKKCREASAEDALLYAEYSLDFAMQAANRALLATLEAIDAQLLVQKELETKEGEEEKTE